MLSDSIQSAGTQNALKLKPATIPIQPNQSRCFVFGVQEPQTVRIVRSLPISWRFPPAFVKGWFQHFLTCFQILSARTQNALQLKPAAIVMRPNHSRCPVFVDHFMYQVHSIEDELLGSMTIVAGLFFVTLSGFTRSPRKKTQDRSYHSL